MTRLTKKSLDNLRAIHSQAKINCAANTDDQAYAAVALYDYWPDIEVGTYLAAGKIVSHSDGLLYRVNEGQGHYKTTTWAPNTATSLFYPIPKTSESGTLDNPITWVSGMVSEKGKYYTDDGITYLCIESSGVSLYGQPKDLTRYFQAM